MRAAIPAVSALFTFYLLLYCANKSPINDLTQQASEVSFAITLANINERLILENSDSFNIVKQEVSKKHNNFWGSRLHTLPMAYIKYTSQDLARVFINFEQAKIHIKAQNKEQLRLGIIKSLLTPYNPEHLSLYSNQKLLLGQEPTLYGQVLDQHQKPIRWHWQAQRFADILINKKLQKKNSRLGDIYTVEIDLVENHTLKKQYNYSGIIRLYGHRYGIDEDLIYAIIRTESNFNPYATSSAKAYGLMQVIPATAGKDVFSLIKNKTGKPSKAYLFQPHFNIDTGTAYLHLLKNHYLKDIIDPITREYAMISAYNGGPSNMLATFARNRRHAIEKMNALTPIQVYKALTTKHPLEESRQYLEKVTTAQKDFQTQLASSQIPI